MIKITAPISAEDSGIHKKMLGSGATTLIISNKEMKDIMKIVKSFKDSSLLIKIFTQTTENETKEQRDGFVGRLLGTVGASLLGNTFVGKGVIRASDGVRTVGEDF